MTSVEFNITEEKIQRHEPKPTYNLKVSISNHTYSVIFKNIESWRIGINNIMR